MKDKQKAFEKNFQKAIRWALENRPLFEEKFKKVILDARKNKKLNQIQNVLAKEGHIEAFKQLRCIVDYPGHLEKGMSWQEVFCVFSDIAGAKGLEKLAQFAIFASVEHESIAEVYYMFGNTLIENKFHGFAATVLSLADQIDPGNEIIVTELVSALESSWNNAEACKRLRASGLVDSSWLCKYLLIFDSIMSGDLREAQKLLPSLKSATVPANFVRGMLQKFKILSPDDSISADSKAAMIQTLEGMLERADCISQVSTLDKQDLRGWHFVVNRALLLHLSPEGFNEGMNGRYAFVQDSMELCLEGIKRLAITLNEMDLHPKQVFILADDRDSAILGHAVARVLNLPVKIWNYDADDKGTSKEPGLIVAYDISSIDNHDLLLSLFRHRPGQILFAHATCWTEDPPFMPDITTYLYQQNTSPWGRRLVLDAKTLKPKHTEEMDGSPEIVANEIVSAQLEQDSLLPNDIEALKKLAYAASQLKNEEGPGAMVNEGWKKKPWSGLPVKSSYFIW